MYLEDEEEDDEDESPDATSDSGMYFNFLLNTTTDF